MENNLDQAMMEYFYGKKTPEEKSTVPQVENTKNVYESEKAARQHMLETVSHREYSQQIARHVADDNIDDIEQLALILKKLCNAAWGDNWGELSPDLKKGEDSSSIILPQITIDINTRDVSEDFGSIKPKLVDIIKETDGNDQETGDAFLIYRQWFDCNVEFNFYGRTNKEARQLQKRFENLIMVYTGYLKRQGISEMFFSREVSPKCSLNYDESTVMRCIYYYIRFESIMPIRQSLINSINAEIGVNQISTDKVKTLINSRKSDPIELEFFDGDNGITYNF
jgi:hypothetical protein